MNVFPMKSIVVWLELEDSNRNAGVETRRSNQAAGTLLTLRFYLFKNLVGMKGFEPSTPTSRT